MILQQTIETEVQKACGIRPGLVCRNVFDWTGERVVAQFSDWLATRPLKIVFILLGAYIVSRLLRRLIDRVVLEMTDDQDMAVTRRLKRIRAKANVEHLLGEEVGDATSMRRSARATTMGVVLRGVSSAVVWSIASLLILSEVGINLAPLIAGAGIVGVAVGFGAQSLVKDFLAGIFMLIEDQYGVGDTIDAGEATGTVEAVNLRTTRIRSVDGTVWHIPNGEISRVGNMSQQWARALIDIDVAYDTDLAMAETVVKEVADALNATEQWGPLILEAPEVWGIQNLGADGITIRLVIKTQPGEQFKVMRELRRRLKDRFDAEGIEIPFPQRVMWVRRDPSDPTLIPASLPGIDSPESET